MKLDPRQKTNIENQFGIEALPEEHPVARQLSDAFGPHTFFLDSAGLNIVEEDPSPENLSGNVIRLARWKDENQTELVRQEPEVLPVTVELKPDDPDPAA